MSAGFTPGPWRAGNFDGDGPLCIQTEDRLGAWICGQLHNPSGNMARAEAEANARLIAAAPDYHDAATPIVAALSLATPISIADSDLIGIPAGQLRALAAAHAKARAESAK